MYVPASEKAQMLGSCQTYSKLLTEIADEYGVIPPRRSGIPLIDCVRSLVRTIVKEECRRAAEEAAFRVFQRVCEQLPSDPREGLYVPATTIRINSGNVGEVNLRAYRGWRRPEVDSPQGA